MSDIVLSERKKNILLNAVGSFIDNALPITSEKVQTEVFNNLSSATLRNELSALESMGYLKQLHTSGGRVPTTKAYNFYVNYLLANQDFDTKLIDEIKNKFVSRSNFILDVLDDLAKDVSDTIKYPIFLELKGYGDLEILAINVIPLITGQALILVQTTAGIINKTVDLKETITEENCKDSSKFLTQNLAGKKIDDVIAHYTEYMQLFESQIKYYQDFFVNITEILKNYVQNKFIKHGSAMNLLEAPEYKDVNSAKKFIKFVENEAEIKKIIHEIDESSNSDLGFSIGDDNVDEYADYSIVKANYSLNNGLVASVGVVGPQRSDYAKIASALKFITDEISQLQNPKE
ncbi:MAG: heat-inducible transcription repressor HrcA [Clostridia bacterium]|nr:heat-inducible transcription repressor HrcA [Clostridia bacterium]